MIRIPFTTEEIRGVNDRLSDDIPVKVWRDSHYRCYHLGFYILEELVIGRRYPHVTFDLSKESNDYVLTDCGYAHQVFGDLLNMPIVQFYRRRLGIARHLQYFIIRMPLLNSVEAYTHRMLEFLTQIKTLADLKRRQLLK